MKQVIFIIAIFQSLILSAQKTMPGGVRGAVVWEITEVIKTGLAELTSDLPGNFDSTLTVRGNIRTINNNPGILFNGGANTLNSTLNLGMLTSFSMFTVCQGIDTIRERVILSLENDTAAEMVLTNRRMAALDMYQYASYNSDPQLYPKIYTYIQNRPKVQSNVTRRLQLGRPPRTQQLPVSFFNGIIPEIIFFSRVLSPVERQKVETYLALKYGIPLNQLLPSSYLNSKEEIIWDAEKNATFNQNIAGIGRDNISGLNQKISECTLTPGVMKLSAAEELQNNSFLVWGDNNRPIRFEEGPEIRKLQRDWKISSSNFKSPVSIETNELSISDINPLHDGEIYWMMVDRSGTGKYPAGQTDYISGFPERSPRFSSVFIDTDNSGDDVFTLLAAPPFFARSIVQSPSCLLSQTGSISCEIVGGSPPFTWVLKGISNGFYASVTKEDRDHFFNGISQGSYLLQVTDADDKIFTGKVWISNSHGGETILSRSYDLIKGEPFVLDGAEGMPSVNYIYSWSTPGGSVLNQEKITVDQPGTYLLSVTDDNNCKSIHEINVREKGSSVIGAVQLFPNPARDRFVIRIRLNRIADINVVISDISGRVLKQTMLRNEDFYQYNDMIQQHGIYIITLVSSVEKESLRLIIQ